MGGRSLVSCFALMAAIGCGGKTADSTPGPTPDAGVPNQPVNPMPVPPNPIPADAGQIGNVSKPPPPVSGGTLLVTRDGKRAVAADPDRDAVTIVGIVERARLHTAVLEPGDEPGRIVEDDAGRVHVVLRRGGAVVTIDVANGDIVRRVNVCGAPRGLAYDTGTGQLHVACAGGELVSLSATDGVVLRTLKLDADLRDVVVRGTGLLVSQFRSARLIAIDANGQVLNRIQTRGINRASRNPEAVLTRSAVETLDGGQPTDIALPGTVIEPVEPDGAWRLLGRGTDQAVLLHQYALAAPINLETLKHPTPQPVTPYGTPIGGCGGLVQPALSLLDETGSMLMGLPIAAPVLAVDAALSPDNAWVALAHAGTPSTDPAMPGAGGGAVTIVSAEHSHRHHGDRDDDPSDCEQPMALISVPGQATAVAFNPSMGGETETHGTWFIVQTREPARLFFYHDPMGKLTATVELPGPSVLNTGHELFHRDTSAGIACASCHLEGAEDGRVWKFTPIGERRTQALNVGIEGTAPFHWDGDMTDFSTLMQEVFVKRMGGQPQPAERMTQLLDWLSHLKPPAPIRAADDPAVARGRQLFESAEVKCATCHSGPKLASNTSIFVGTTEAGHLLQVPSLVGVGYRAPFLHNGCASTLRDRFNPACGGGDNHGHTSQLKETQLGDLVAFLESL